MYVNISTWSWAECLCPPPPANSHVEILPSNVGALGGGALGGDQVMSIEPSRRGSVPLLRGPQRAPSFCYTFCVSTQLEDCGHNLGGDPHKNSPMLVPDLRLHLPEPSKRLGVGHLFMAAWTDDTQWLGSCLMGDSGHHWMLAPIVPEYKISLIQASLQTLPIGYLCLSLHVMRWFLWRHFFLN